MRFTWPRYQREIRWKKIPSRKLCERNRSDRCHGTRTTVLHWSEPIEKECTSWIHGAANKRRCSSIIVDVVQNGFARIKSGRTIGGKNERLAWLQRIFPWKETRRSDRCHETPSRSTMTLSRRLLSSIDRHASFVFLGHWPFADIRWLAKIFEHWAQKIFANMTLYALYDGRIAKHFHATVAVTLPQ